MRNASEPSGSYFQRDRTWHPPAYFPDYKTSVKRSPQAAPISVPNTVSELTGPVFGQDMLGPLDNDLIRNFAPGATEDAIGPRIVVYGRVQDEAGRPTPPAATGTRRRAISARSIRISAAAGAA